MAPQAHSEKEHILDKLTFHTKYRRTVKSPLSNKDNITLQQHLLHTIHFLCSMGVTDGPARSRLPFRKEVIPNVREDFQNSIRVLSSPARISFCGAGILRGENVVTRSPTISLIAPTKPEIFRFLT